MRHSKIFPALIFMLILDLVSTTFCFQMNPLNTFFNFQHACSNVITDEVLKTNAMYVKVTHRRINSIITFYIQFKSNSVFIVTFSFFFNKYYLSIILWFQFLQPILCNIPHNLLEYF